MQYVELGPTGIEVSRIGVGTWPMAGTRVKGDYGDVDPAQAARAITAALDAGVNLFDTAPTYGEGNAEVMLGRALAGRRDEAVIVSKCGNDWDPDEQRWVPDSSYDAIVRGVESSLDRLGTDRLDVLLLHNPDPGRELDDLVRAVDDLTAAGKIRGFGVSNHWPDQVRAVADRADVAVAQMSYHMFDRRIERELLDVCEAVGASVMAFGTLAHGLLSGAWRSVDDLSPDDWRRKGSAFGLPIFTAENFAANLGVVEELREIAGDLDLSLPQLALAWVLHEPRVAVALTGVVHPGQLEENIVASEAQLGDGDLARIDAILEGAAGTSRDAPLYRI